MEALNTRQLKPIHELIREQSCRFPDKTAVLCGNERIGFGELEQKSDALAAMLQAKGIGRGERVALLLEPGCELIIALLGVLKSGAAYVPLSASYPLARVLNILDACECEMLIGDGGCRDLLSDIDLESLILDRDSLPADEQLFDSPLPADGEDTAYVLFTSGSSGVPKGVKVLHRNLSYYTQWSSAFFEDAVGNRLPLTSSVHFAAAVSQIYSCLAAGETLHVLPHILGEPSRLLDWYAEHQGYGLYIVPSVWAAILEWANKNDVEPSRGPSALFLSGEDVPEQLIADTFARFPGIAIWNLYGPTEAVANLSAKRIAHASDVTIGRTLPGTVFYVVKEDGREAGVHESGRLYACGPGISAGYIGDADLTEAAFFDYASKNDGLVRVYDTGDYVRCVEDGEYRFIGRRDQQIKIHGQRIELAEIERCLYMHADVQKAAVFPIDGERPPIAAYIQSVDGRSPSVGDLRHHLLRYLTELMLPDRWVFVDSFPQLANGKVDRKALPAPADERPDLGYEFLAPSGDREQKIAAAFAKVLGIRDVGMIDSFFDLGGNSLKALELLIEIEERFHYRPDFATLFECPSPRALLACIPESAALLASPVHRQHVPDDDKTPLTDAQQGLWFFLQTYPDNTAYTIAYSVAIEGELDVNRFEQALREVIRCHRPLSSLLQQQAGKPWFFPDQNHAPSLAVESLEPIPSDRREAYVRDSISGMASRPLGIDDRPPYRCRLYRVGARKHIFAWVVSHLAFDGESFAVFIKELALRYRGREFPLSATGFADAVQRRTAYASSQQHDRDLDFWKAYLSGVAELSAFPAVYQASEPLPVAGSRVSAMIDPQLRDRLSQLCREKGVTLNMLLLAAFTVALQRFGESEEYVIASPFSNRLAKSDRALIGYFANTLLYRLHCHPDLPFSTLVSEIRKDTIRILDHQQPPMGELVEILRKQGTKIPASVFSTLFAYHDMSEWAEDIAGLRLTGREVFTRHAKCELHLECFDDLESIALEFTYADAVLDERMALNVINVIMQALKDIVANYDAKVSTLASILPSEREEVLRHSIAEKTDGGEAMTLYGLFDKCCDDFADHTAIAYRDRTLTYSALQSRVAACASHLAGLGLSAGEPLGIYADHSPEMVIAILAASALAYPYVPLDPSYPDARIRYIANHAGIRCVLTTSDRDIRGLEEGRSFVFIDELADSQKMPLPPTFARTAPSDLLYIIYTSGSTGDPKGVMVPNRGVANYLQWMKERFGTGTGTRILAKTSISFDISVWELFLPLISGGTLVLEMRADIESPEQIAQVIREKQVNIVQFVPSGLKLFCEAGMFAQTPSLEMIFCGGERLSTELKDNVLSRFTGELYNLYGPTEASIFMCYSRCEAASPYRNVPVGRPITNGSVYVLDKAKRLLPRNMPGDLYIGGSILADGYWKSPEQTDRAFIPAPEGLPEQRLYVTGDRGRMLSDGNIEFLGRQDHQVKIRGYRVELQEVERAVESFPGIRQAVVFMDEHGEDDARLYAAIVPEEGATIALNALRDALRAQLPSYMVPASIIPVDGIPLLPNGKIDYKSIGRDDGPHAFGQAQEIPASTVDDVEEALSRIWAEVIGGRNFTLTDNFFDVGGHSLLFLKVRDKIKERLGAEFSVVELYQSPNIAGLAAQYRKKHGATPPSPPISAIRKRISDRRKRIHGK